MEDGYKGFEYIIYLGILVVFYFVLKSPKKSEDKSDNEQNNNKK